MKPEDPAAREARAVRAGLATRCQHDQGRRTVDRELPGDLEPLDVGQADVEQDEVRPERTGGREPGRAVVGLADDVEPVGLEQGARLDAEAGVVVDDEDGVHGAIVAWPSAASPTGLTRTQGQPCFRAAVRVSESLDERPPIGLTEADLGATISALADGSHLSPAVNSLPDRTPSMILAPFQG